MPEQTEARVKYSLFCVKKGREFSENIGSSFHLYTIDIVGLFTQL